MPYLQKHKGKRYNDDKVDVSHKNIVIKNLANKLVSSEYIDDDFDSDTSNESTLSEGALSKSKKRSPKFVSEPNLSNLDINEETPKNTKKRSSRLFRSKVSGSQNFNKKYQKRMVIRSTPKCVSCIDDQDSENDLSQPEKSLEYTPKKNEPTENEIEFKMHYLTSTPGISECLNEDCMTPYTVNFRRASMSPITKSTQKLSKAMQVCRMSCLCHCHVLIYLFF